MEDEQQTKGTKKLRSKWLGLLNSGRAENQRRRDAEMGDTRDSESDAGMSPQAVVQSETRAQQLSRVPIEVFKRMSIERGKLGNVPFCADIDELMNLVPNLHDVPFCDTMPIAHVDYPTEPRSIIKSQLCELIGEEIHGKLSDKGPFHTMFEGLIATITVDNDIEKECVRIDYKQRMNKAFKLLDDKRLLYLMDLLAFELPIECPNSFGTQRDESKFQSNKRFSEGMKLVFDNLKTSSSDMYNNFLLQVLESNSLSTASLSDEHCLFSMRFNYAKVTLNSLKEAMKLFFPEKKGHENKTQQEQINKEKEHESKLDVRVYDFIRFETNVLSLGPKKSAIDLYPMFLDETAFITVAMVRDLLVFMAANIIEKHDTDTKRGKDVAERHMQHNVDKHLAKDAKVVHEFVISKVPVKFPKKDDKFYTNVRNRLKLYVEVMNEYEVLMSSSQTSAISFETDNLIQQIWDSIVKTLTELNKEDMAFIAETRSGRTRQLHHSAGLIARKYLFKILCATQSAIVTFTTNTFVSLPSNWEKIVQMVKMKMDILIDNAFIHHLKDNAIAILSLVGLKDIKAPDFGRRISEAVEATNIREILSQLIALIKYKMLVGEPYSSPLYENLVSEMTKYLGEIRAKETLNDVQVPENAKNLIALETSDIIEREMLLRYMYIQPQLECLQQVAEIGADLMLDIGMKKSVRDA